LHIVNMLNKKAIVLDFQNEVTGKDVKIGLLSNNNEAAGNICIKGIELCPEAKAKTADFDEAYFKETIQLKDLTKLRIEKTGEFGGTTIDLSKHFTSLIYTTTEKEVLNLPPNVGVEFTEY